MGLSRNPSRRIYLLSSHYMPPPSSPTVLHLSSPITLYTSLSSQSLPSITITAFTQNFHPKYHHQRIILIHLRCNDKPWLPRSSNSFIEDHLKSSSAPLTTITITIRWQRIGTWFTHIR